MCIRDRGKAYKDANEVLMAYERKDIDLHTRVCVLTKSFRHKVFTDAQKEKYLVTTPGKIIFNEVLPDTFPYLCEVSKENLENITPDKFFIEKGKNLVEEVANMPLCGGFVKKDLEKIIAQIFKRYKTTETSIMLDKLKDLGFKYSTISGITFSLSDVVTSDKKQEIVNETEKVVSQIEKQFKREMCIRDSTKTL